MVIENNNRRFVYFAVLCILIILVYGKSLTFGFVTDDFSNFYGTSRVVSLSDLDKIFSTPQFIHQNYYRPLDTLYFLLTFNIFKDSYFLYHLANLTFHIIAVLMFYSFLNDVRKNEPLYNLLFASIFAVHPVNVEPICWISARNQLIIAILLLLLIKSVKHYLEAKNILLIFIPVILVTGLFFHEIFIVSIFWLSGYIYLVRNEANKRLTRNIALSTLFVLIIYFVLRLLFLKKFAGESYPFSERFYSMFLIVKEYLKIIFNPFALRVHYYDLKAVSQINLQVVLSILVFLLVIACIIIVRKNKIALFGGVTFLLSLLPSSGIITLVHKSLISDRYLFIPLMAFLLFFSEVFKPIYTKFKAMTTVMLCLFVMFFSVFSNIRCNIWQDDLSNALQRVKEFPESYIERSNLGSSYLMANRIDEAEKELLLSLKMASKPYAQSYLNLSYIYKLKGDLNGAVMLLEKYLEFDDKNVSVLYNLGVLKQEIGDIVTAKKLYEKAYALSNENSLERADILNNLGIIYLNTGDLNNAERCFEEAYKISPYQENIRRNYEMIIKNR